MTIPIPLLIVVSLIVSAHARLNAVVLGQPVSVSALGLIALAVILVLAIALLWIARTLVRDGLRLFPYLRTVNNWST